LKLPLAVFRTEIKSLALFLGMQRGGLVDVHTANRVFFHLSGNNFGELVGGRVWGRLGLGAAREKVTDRGTDQEDQEQEIEESE
jgi:hypothetical protein